MHLYFGRNRNYSVSLSHFTKQEYVKEFSRWDIKELRTTLMEIQAIFKSPGLLNIVSYFELFYYLFIILKDGQHKIYHF